MGSSRSSFLGFVTATIADLGDKFARRRVWSPRSVFTAVLLLTRGRRRCSYRELMRTVVDDTAGLLEWERRPTLSSFTEARAKLSAEACRSILRTLVDRLTTLTPKRFRHPTGRRFIGIDGVRLIAPRSADTRRGLHQPKYDTGKSSHCPQALTVVAVDLTRRLPLDFVVLPKGRGEREGARQLAQNFAAGDVAVMDRGFPARSLVSALVKAKVDIVLRMTATKVGSWPEVVAFLRSGETQRTVEVGLDDGSTVPMRLIRRNFRPGRPQRGQKPQTLVILTSLMAEEFDRDAIIKLYESRWGVETLFREMKCEFDIERFHSRSVVGMQQEVAAVLAWIAYASALQLTAEATLPEGRRVYRSLCITSGTRIVEAIIAGKDPEVVFRHELDSLCVFHYAPKAGRSFPRERKSPIGRFDVRVAK